MNQFLEVKQSSFISYREICEVITLAVGYVSIEPPILIITFATQIGCNLYGALYNKAVFVRSSFAGAVPTSVVLRSMTPKTSGLKREAKSANGIASAVLLFQLP